MGAFGLAAALSTAATLSSHVAHAGCVPASVVNGVDLNPDGDGTLDWGSSGAGFAIIKATQGNYYTDGDFADNWAALKAAGVVRGAYHFFDATVSGVDQATYFLNVMGTLEPGDLPPTLDIECPTSNDEPDSDGCLYAGFSGDATGAQITTAMNDFLAAVKSATGVMPIVYSYGSWFSDNGVDTTGLQNYPLWLADYNSCYTTPAPWSAPAIWQYNDNGTVSGNNVDVDYFLGTMSQLTAFAVGGSGTGTGSSTSSSATSSDTGEDAGTRCTVTETGESGECMDTTACAAMPGHMSTPGYCPGPDDVQCCTVVPGEDAGTTSSTASHHATSSSGGTSHGSGATSETSSRGGGGGGGRSGGGPIPGGPTASTSTARAKLADAGTEDVDSSGGCAVGPNEPLAGGVSAALVSGLVTVFAGARRRRRAAR